MEKFSINERIIHSISCYHHEWPHEYIDKSQNQRECACYSCILQIISYISYKTFTNSSLSPKVSCFWITRLNLRSCRDCILIWCTLFSFSSYCTDNRFLILCIDNIFSYSHSTYSHYDYTCDDIF